MFSKRRTSLTEIHFQSTTCPVEMLSSETFKPFPAFSSRIWMSLFKCKSSQRCRDVARCIAASCKLDEGAMRSLQTVDVYTDRRGIRLHTCSHILNNREAAGWEDEPGTEMKLLSQWESTLWCFPFIFSWQSHWLETLWISSRCISRCDPALTQRCQMSTAPTSADIKQWERVRRERRGRDLSR